MNKLILTAAIIALTGCCPPVTPEIMVQAPFRSYVDAFKVRYSVSSNVTVKRGDLPPGVIGQCELTPFSALITIDGPYWDHSLEYERESLMYHELGHCLLRRAHVNQIDEDGCPRSLMFPSNNVNECYRDNRERYLKELGENRNTLNLAHVGVDEDEDQPMW